MGELRLRTEAACSAGPVIIRPAAGSGSVEALAELLDRDRVQLHELLLRHGALLFRGFGASSAQDLSRVFAAAGERSMPYVGGISPRTQVGQDVYTSTELPPGVRIGLHNELAYLAVQPRHLWFACLVPASDGGETTLADGRAIFADLDPTVRQRFLDRGVRYTSTFHGQSAWFSLVERWQKVTKSWMEAFETSDRQVVAVSCRALGAAARWLPSGRLVIETERPAVVEHPETGETVWFNSAHLFRLSPRGIGWLRYLLSRLFFVKRSTRTHDAHFADGGEIDVATLDHLFDVLDAHTVAVRWERGDVLWVDNVRCMHGRNPFHGQRRVLAAMTQ
ncbi:MAG: TauD/TfdA family dioxygenase [Gaiellaceae bacterium]